MKRLNLISWARKHPLVAGLAGVGLPMLGLAASVPLMIIRGCYVDETQPADAAIVLGAAVYNDKPSPVFTERIRHGVNLYNQGLVKKVIFTGGQAEGDSMGEAEAARTFALEHGVPPADVLMETSSTTTWENFVFALPVMQEAGIRKVLVVSDPMHMRRSMAIARSLGMEAYASATPTTKYVSLDSKWLFLKHETKYYFAFMARRIWGLLD